MEPYPIVDCSLLLPWWEGFFYSPGFRSGAISSIIPNYQTCRAAVGGLEAEQLLYLPDSHLWSWICWFLLYQPQFLPFFLFSLFLKSNSLLMIFFIVQDFHSLFFFGYHSILNLLLLPILYFDSVSSRSNLAWHTLVCLPWKCLAHSLGMSLTQWTSLGKLTRKMLWVFLYQNHNTKFHNLISFLKWKRYHILYTPDKLRNFRCQNTSQTRVWLIPGWAYLWIYTLILLKILIFLIYSGIKFILFVGGAFFMVLWLKRWGSATFTDDLICEYIR